MTSNFSGTPTPLKVKKIATQEAHLPRTALLGIFGTKAAPNALIRLPHGKTQTVGIGDRIGKRVVIAIGSDQIILIRNNAQTVLRMPTS